MLQVSLVRVANPYQLISPTRWLEPASTPLRPGRYLPIGVFCAYRAIRLNNQKKCCNDYSNQPPQILEAEQNAVSTCRQRKLYGLDLGAIQ